MLGRVTATPSAPRGSYFLAVPAIDMRLRPSPQPIAASVQHRPARRRWTGGSGCRAEVRARVRAGSGEDLGSGWLTAGQRELGPGVVVARGVHHDARVRHARQVELADGQAERSGLRMPVGEGARLDLGDLVPGPELGELTAHGGQAADVFFPVRVADVPAVRGAQPRDHVADLRVV